jgi:hypothetical protein
MEAGPERLPGRGGDLQALALERSPSHPAHVQ